jgi:hypothetical protein
MDLAEMTIRHRGYRAVQDDEEMREYRIGSFEMDDGTVYGFEARETGDGVVADYRETEQDPVAAIRQHEYDLAFEDRLPGLEDPNLEGYGEAIAHELTEQSQPAEQILEPADD